MTKILLDSKCLNQKNQTCKTKNFQGTTIFAFLNNLGDGTVQLVNLFPLDSCKKQFLQFKQLNQKCRIQGNECKEQHTEIILKKYHLTTNKTLIKQKSLIH